MSTEALGAVDLALCFMFILELALHTLFHSAVIFRLMFCRGWLHKGVVEFRDVAIRIIAILFLNGRNIWNL